MKYKNISMNYDEELDVAYIKLNSKKGEIGSTDSFSMEGVEFGSINFDFDSDNKIVGIEILSASKFLKLDVKE